MISGCFYIGFIDFMLACKTLTDFTNLYSRNKKCLKITEYNSHETHNIYLNLNASQLSATPLNNQKQFRLNKINGIKDYFIAEIKERELMRKRLSKYIASFNYFDKSLTLFRKATQPVFPCNY